jgi:hypothetical protein
MNIMNNVDADKLMRDWHSFFQEGVDSGCCLFVEAKQKADEQMKRLDELSAEFPGFDRKAWLKTAFFTEKEKEDMKKRSKRSYDDIVKEDIERFVLAIKSRPDLNNL